MNVGRVASGEWSVSCETPRFLWIGLKQFGLDFSANPPCRPPPPHPPLFFFLIFLFLTILSLFASTKIEDFLA